MTNPAPGWYDDGTGQSRWWDGGVWTAHLAPSPIPPSGVSREFTLALDNLPMYFWVYTDPSNPTCGWVRVYHALGEVPVWDAPDRFADAEFDDYSGPPANVLIHSAQPEQLHAVHPELREIVEDLDREIRSRAREQT